DHLAVDSTPQPERWTPCNARCKLVPRPGRSCLCRTGAGRQQRLASGSPLTAELGTCPLATATDSCPGGSAATCPVTRADTGRAGPGSTALQRPAGRTG